MDMSIKFDICLLTFFYHQNQSHFSDVSSVIVLWYSTVIVTESKKNKWIMAEVVDMYYIYPQILVNQRAYRGSNIKMVYARKTTSLTFFKH